MKRPLLLCALVLGLSACGKKTPGQAAYGPHCGICHHGGSGMPGETPPLVGRLNVIAQTPEGRHYLIDVLLDGLRGKFKTEGYTYNFSMSPYRNQLTDQQIADILNWLIASKSAHPPQTITPADVAEARKHEGNPAETYLERQHLDAQHPIP